MLRQLIGGILTIWIIVTTTFVVLRLLPGNAIQAQLQGSGLSEEFIEARKAALGLNDSILIQYVRYMGKLLQGDLGLSLYSGQTVNEIVSQRFMTTLQLAAQSFVWMVVLGIWLGIQGTAGHPFLRTASKLLVNMAFSVPIFWSATLALFTIATITDAGAVRFWLAPLLLGLHSSATIGRMLYTEIQQITDAHFIVTARAKGLSELQIYLRHILKNAMIPIIPVIALQTGILMSGTVITESIFGFPGLGLMLVDATLQRDYPIVQGGILIIAGIFLFINAAADWGTRLLDPRIQR